MRLFEKLSIRRKLLAIIMLTSSVALLLACVAFVLYDLTLLRRTMIEELTAITRMVGRMNNITIPFDDAKVANDNLSALQQNPHIQAAAILTKDGRILGQFEKPGIPPLAWIEVPARLGHRFQNGWLEVFEPIILDQEVVGTMYIRADLEQLYARIRQYILIMALVLALSSAVAFLLSINLQKVISFPIVELARKTNVVSRTKDYSVRAEKQSNDEIGELMDGFNEMLSQLQLRDEALRNANDALEERVKERTAELQEEISFRKQIEEALRLSEIRFRSLVQTAREAIIVADANGLITLWNDGAAKLFGYHEAEILGRPLAAIFSEAVQSSDQSILSILQAQSAAAGAGQSVEFQGKRKDATEFPIDLSFTSWETGGNTFYTVILRDITERKRAVEQLTAFALKLEQSNRELQDFAYVASHDLQEPLRKVQAFGDRLKTMYATALAGDGADYLDRMQNAARRMQNLINDLLAFSRVTTKANPFQQVNLNQILREVISDLEVRVQQSGGHIEFGDLPVIEADPMQMRQLFQNLLSNALKFHKPGSTPHVKVKAEMVEDFLPPRQAKSKTSCCRISIQDNGIGFDEKYLDRIFTVFQRLHSRMSYEGTGIGLAICRKIVERHGGNITARSSPGAGATFIVILPLVQQKETK